MSLAVPGPAAALVPAAPARPAWVRIDGCPVPPEQAAVSVFDHGLLYGDGLMEGLRFANGRAFELRAHLERLGANARVLQLALPWSLDEIAAQVDALIADTGRRDGYIRLMVTRGVGTLGLSPAGCTRPRLILIASAITVYGADVWERGLRAVTLAGRQKALATIDPRIKTLNYLVNVLGKLDAQAAGADEGIFLTDEGYVSEGTADNVFVVRGGAVRTPAVPAGGLDGITARCVLQLAARAGIGAERTPLARYDLYTADEVFLTGTAAGVVPVTVVDGRPIGDGRPGAVTRRLATLLNEAMQRGTA